MPAHRQSPRSTSSDTTLRVESAVLNLGHFTVADICDRTSLTPAQVRPVLRVLRKRGYVLLQSSPKEHDGAPHRPPGQYQLTSNKSKLQSLADRAYRLRRILDPNASTGKENLELIQADMEQVELMLDLCDSGTSSQPLTRAQLQKVEHRLNAVYLELENMTYRAGLNLNDPARAGHPVVLAWNRFNTCKQTLDRIADRWEGAEAKRQAASFKIVTDPRFLDSALFLWVCRQLAPQIPGTAIECIPVSWREVPRFVANNANAIGFYNRRLELSRLEDERVSYWSDLCVYRGYALLAHRSADLLARPANLEEAEKFLKRFIRQSHERQQQPPRIISIGADTVWRFGDNLTRGVPRTQFEEKPYDDVNEALQAFRDQPHSLFVGGLPQRLTAQRLGFIPVIDAEHRPALYSINGLVHNTQMENRRILQAIELHWFETVSRLKRDDPEFRSAVFQSMLDAQPQGFKTPFEMWMFDEIVGQSGWMLFAETPASMSSAIVDLQSQVFRAAILPEYPVDLQEHFRRKLSETEEPLGGGWRGVLGENGHGISH